MRTTPCMGPGAEGDVLAALTDVLQVEKLENMLKFGLWLFGVPWANSKCCVPFLLNPQHPCATPLTALLSLQNGSVPASRCPPRMASPCCTHACHCTRWVPPLSPHPCPCATMPFSYLSLHTGLHAHRHRPALQALRPASA